MTAATGLPVTYFEGVVSVKRTFLWAERKLVIFSDRIELSHVDRPNSHKTVIHASNLSLAPIVRHHASFEFTVFASQGGQLQRIRIRITGQPELERVYSLLEKVKNSHVDQQRSFNADLKRRSPSHQVLVPPKSHGEASTSMFELCSSANPHMSINVLVAGLILFSAWLAPLLNSWLLTISVVVTIGVFLAALLAYLHIVPPSLHILLVLKAPVRRCRKDSSASSLASDAIAFATTPLMKRSRSYIERRDFNVSSLEEVEARSSSGRCSVDDEPDSSRIFFSDSSQYLSALASESDYASAYAVMRAMGEAIVSLLATQPGGLGPPSSLAFVLPEGTALPPQAVLPIVIDHSACSEWSVIRNKNGIRVLTSKLGPNMTRWPVISAAGTVRAAASTVYRCVATPEIFKHVDEFGGEFNVVEYLELAHQEPLEETASSLVEGSLLETRYAPFLIKYQEMKSVWPVQPRDYLAAQAGFDLQGGCKFLLSKSIDPHPKDPFPEGHEGFVRGALTASAFLIVPNETNPNHSDVWTFLHCDMKGSLSGNGKIADFITQNQMPKFFAKLEAVCIEQEQS